MLTSHVSIVFIRFTLYKFNGFTLLLIRKGTANQINCINHHRDHNQRGAICCQFRDTLKRSLIKMILVVDGCYESLKKNLSISDSGQEHLFFFVK